MTVIMMEQPSITIIASPERKRALSCRPESAMCLPSATVDVENNDNGAATKNVRSCLKKSNCSEESQSTVERTTKRRCRRVHWNSVNEIAPPSSSDYRNPALWWRTQDLQIRKFLDRRTAKSNATAQAYKAKCTDTRTALVCSHNHSAADDEMNHVVLGALESSTKKWGAVANKGAELKLKRVFVKDLLSGYMEGFRGMESAGGSLGGGPQRAHAIRAAIREIVSSQRSCSCEELSKRAAANSLVDRCWARLLALGDELMVACDQ